MSDEMLKQRHRDEFEAAQTMAKRIQIVAVPSPIYYPPKHTKMSYAKQRRLAKQRRKRK